jgi:SAM-dependent methyltransferase
MLDMCDNSICYKNENAEYFSYREKFDVISVMFALHEIPRKARICIIENIKRNLNVGGICIILDISPEYIVTPMMRGGEPYVDEYVHNIRDDLYEFKEETIVDNHLSRWTLKK